MKTLSWSCLLAATLAVSALAATINFDSDTPGKMPAGWTSAMTHTGGAPRWEVVKDTTAPSKPNVLAQLSNDTTNGRFPLAIYDGANFANGQLTVKFKPISGAVDASGGLVWRYRDKNNYYVVRANALENNVVLYKVVNGRRSSLAPKGTRKGTYGIKQTVTAREWHTLRVTFDESRFVVDYDGKTLFQVEDGSITGPGKVGLWTKADSVTHFDNFQVSKEEE